MRKSLASMTIAACAILSLGGCKSIFSVFHPSSRGAHVLVDNKAEAYAASQLVAGRQALEDGQFASAIGAFSSIRIVPGYEATAYNGLAIAYSNIGRPDLSEAYFTRAIALSPGDARFQRNLALFRDAQAASQLLASEAQERTLAAAEQDKAETARPIAPLQSGAGRSRAIAIHIEPQTSHVTRLSSNEVLLVSDPAIMARTTARTHRTGLAAKAPTRARRASVASRSSKRAYAYPVRLTFARSEFSGGSR
jgi:tetratricopeptide (TPR) repeat protein